MTTQATWQRFAPAGRSAPTAGQLAGAATRSRPRPYLHQVDVVRLLTFVGVIGVHSIPLTADPQSAVAGALVMLLHFTRDTFFLISAFVLCYVQGSEPVRLRTFWPRRFLLIGVPYVAWTVIYWWIPIGLVPQSTDLTQLGYQLLTGTGNYHLYFLLVSMQLYLLFPALLWLVRRTTGHHLALLVGSGVVELGLMAMTHWLQWPGVWATLQANEEVLSPLYLFYFVAGTVAAVHHERLHRWVVEHPWSVLGIVVGAALLQLGAFAVQVAITGSLTQAYDPLQPSVVPWSLAVTLGFYALGCMFARRRRTGTRFARLLDQAAMASFGVFLVHPLFLNVVLGRWLSYGYSFAGPTLSSVLAWSGTLLLSFAFAAVVIRTPLALPLTGRRRLHPAEKKGTS